MSLKPKIVFMGTPEFGAIILKKLIEYMPSFVLCFKGPFQPILVITAPDQPVGRKQIRTGGLTPPPVKVLAEKYIIPVLQPEKIKHYKFTIESLNPDLIIVAAYGQILPKEILEIPKYGCLNLHPSLLPCWRGASPIQYTILHGDKEGGVTIILMDEKMDHGPILAQRELEIPLIPKELPTVRTQQGAERLVRISNAQITSGELSKKLAELGAQLLIETIPKWIQGKIKPQPQDESKATYTKILKKEDGRIDWTKPAKDIERQIRAFNPWPGSFSLWPQNSKDLRLKILKADISVQENHGPFGIRGKTFLAPNNKIAVQTGKDFLVITDLQLEGKKPTTSEEFLRGHPEFIGTILE